MANSKHSQNLLNQNLTDKDIHDIFSSAKIFDRSIIIALLSLVLVSWFINHFLIT